MYGIYNTYNDYTFVFTNRCFTHTLRKMYIELHKEEFTDEEYLLSQYNPFLPNLSHKFLRYNPSIHFNTKKIYISRNPYARALSSFYLFRKINPYSSNTKLAYLKLLFEKKLKHLNFENFLIFLNNENCTEPHLSTQTFNYSEFSENLQVYKFSQSLNGLLNFFKELGFEEEKTLPIIENSLKIQYYTSGKKIHYTENREYHRLTSSQLNDMNDLPSLKNMITPSTENLIYTFYKNDFDILGYDRYNIFE
jgi:hypothetical protein